MKDDLKSLIEQEFEKLNPNDEDREDLQRIIKDLVDNQNKNARQENEYRLKLFNALEKLKKMNIPVSYNEKMTNEELEKILKEVKF